MEMTGFQGGRLGRVTPLWLLGRRDLDYIRPWIFGLPVEQICRLVYGRCTVDLILLPRKEEWL